MYVRTYINMNLRFNGRSAVYVSHDDYHFIVSRSNVVEEKHIISIFLDLWAEKSMKIGSSSFPH